MGIFRALARLPFTIPRTSRLWTPLLALVALAATCDDLPESGRVSTAPQPGGFAKTAPAPAIAAAELDRAAVGALNSPETPTVAPTAAPSPEPSAPTPAPMSEPTETPAPIETHTPAPSPASTETSVSEPTHTPLPEPTETPAPIETHTPAPSPAPIETHTPTPSPEPTAAPASEPTHTPTPTPITHTPTPSPAPTETPAPTAAPSPEPEAADTASARLSEIISWFENPPDETRARAASVLSNLYALDPNLGVSAARLPWLGDANQLSSLDALGYIADGNADLAILAAEYAWFVDGVDYEDPYRSEESALLSLGNADGALSNSLKGAAWLSDDVTVYEASALRSLESVSGVDSDMAKRLASSPWIRDGVARHEAFALDSLAAMTDWNPEFARRIAEYSLDATARNRNVYLITAMHRIRSFNEDGFNRVIDSSWFTDGLDDEERAFLTALGYTGSPEFDDLLESRSALSTTFSLPMSGEVSVWIFRSGSSPLDENLLSIVEGGARIAERFMGTPFPTNDVIMLVVKSRESVGGFAGVFDEILIRIGEDDADYRTVIHEISHFYFNGAPFWFNEGGAEFMAAYSADSLGFESWEEERQSHERSYEYCAENGIGDIRELSVLDKHGQLLQQGCSYALGRYFFINLFEAMGEAAFSSALRDLYLSGARDEIEYTDDLIYRAFLKHVPAERMDEFRAVYSRLHGAGPSRAAKADKQSGARLAQNGG